MKVDAKLTAILSDFCLDIAKAFFVATFVTPSLSGISSLLGILFVLTKGFLNVILFLVASWQLAKLGDRYERD